MTEGPDLSKMKKLCFRRELNTSAGLIVVEGPVTPEHLKTLRMDSELKAFRTPDLQHQALVEIAELPEGRMVIGRIDDVIVGYVTFHYPGEFEHWGNAGMLDLLELGAIEIAPLARGLGLARLLLRVSFEDEAMEDFIVISTEYYWHWDLDGTDLSVWKYKEVMEKVMGTVGLRQVDTDEEDISSHPANCLMMRAGSRVPKESLKKFDALRFKKN